LWDRVAAAKEFVPQPPVAEEGSFLDFVGTFLDQIHCAMHHFHQLLPRRYRVAFEELRGVDVLKLQLIEHQAETNLKKLLDVKRIGSSNKPSRG
jgi:hypothetical protein